MTCLHHITCDVIHHIVCDIIGDRNSQICYHLLGSILGMWLLIDQNVTLRHVPCLGEGQGCRGRPRYPHRPEIFATQPRLIQVTACLARGVEEEQKGL